MEKIGQQNQILNEVFFNIDLCFSSLEEIEEIICEIEESF